MTNAKSAPTVTEALIPHPYETFDDSDDRAYHLLKDATAIADILALSTNYLSDGLAEDTLANLCWLQHRMLSTLKEIQDSMPNLGERLAQARSAAESIKSINAFARDVNRNNKPKVRRAIEALTARTGRDADSIIKLANTCEEVCHG